MNTDIPVHAKVRCDDGVVGTSEALIFDPRRRLVSHVVVRERLWPNNERLLPIGLIDRTTEEEIHLRCSVADAKRQDAFIKTRFVQVPWLDGNSLDETYVPYGAAYFWPYTYPKVSVGEEQIPPGELAIHRGSNVEATDGTVGRVEGFLVDPDDRITYVVVRSGHLIRREFAIGGVRHHRNRRGPDPASTVPARDRGSAQGGASRAREASPDRRQRAQRAAVALR